VGICWRVPEQSQVKILRIFKATLSLYRSRPVFDKVLINQSQPSQLQIFKVQLNRW